MNALFVTPSESGTGEALTARYIAERLTADGHSVSFLSSRVTAALLEPVFHDAVRTLTSDREGNLVQWRTALHHRPDVIVFADYPLLGMTSGASPLASDAWIRELAQVPAPLITLDHLGYAQRPRTVYFGAPHLAMHAETFSPLPPQIHVLLPCPIHEPGNRAGRIGTAVSYWDLPLAVAASARSAVRRRFLDSDDDYLIVHSTPGWAIDMARRFALPYYSAVSTLLAWYLRSLPRGATLVSVNDGSLLKETPTGSVRIRNVGPMPSADFDALILSADLFVTDNAISSSLAKAACGLVPAAVLGNSFRLAEIVAIAEPCILEVVLAMERARIGSVFPFEVFPIWSSHDLDELDLLRDNGYSGAVVRLELFGGEHTRHQLRALLADEERRRALAAGQRAYIASLQQLPAADAVVCAIARAWRREVPCGRSS